MLTGCLSLKKYYVCMRVCHCYRKRSLGITSYTKSRNARRTDFPSHVARSSRTYPFPPNKGINCREQELDPRRGSKDAIPDAKHPDSTLDPAPSVWLHLILKFLVCHERTFASGRFGRHLDCLDACACPLGILRWGKRVWSQREDNADL